MGKKRFCIFICYFFISFAFAQTRKFSVENQKNINQVNAELYFPSGHNEDIRYISWSPSSKFIATIGFDKTLRIWSVEEKKELKTLSRKTTSWSKCLWSPNEKYICCEEDPNNKALKYNNESETVVFEVESGKKIYSLKNVHQPQCFVENERFIIAFQDLQIKIFDVFSGKEIKNIISYGEWSEPSVSISSNNRYIAVTVVNDNKLWIFDIESGYQKIVYNLGNMSKPCGSAWSPNGNFIVVWSDSNNTPHSKVIDINTGSIVDIKIECGVRSVSWSPDERFLVFPTIQWAADDDITIFHTKTGMLYKKVKAIKGYEFKTKDFVSWSPSGKYIAENAGDSLHIFEYDSGEKYHSFVGGGRFSVKSISWNSNGDYFVSTNYTAANTRNGQNEKIWNINTAEKVFALPENDIHDGKSYPADDILYSPNGEYIAAAYPEEVIIFEKNGKIYSRVKFHACEVLSWSADSQSVVIGGGFYKKPQITIYDIKSKNIKRVLKMTGDRLESLSYSLNGKIATKCTEYSSDIFSSDILIWNAMSGEKIKTLSPELSSFCCFCFSPDGKYLATSEVKGSPEREERIHKINIYDTNTWNISKTFNTEDVSADFIDWNSNGKFLVCTDTSEKTIFMLDIASSKKIWERDDFSSNCIKFSPNGIYILSAGADGIIRLLDSKMGDTIYSIVCGDNGEYLSYTSEGYFTGTDWAIKNLVYVVNGMEVTGLNQLESVYFRPDLVAAKLRGEDISEIEESMSLNQVIATGEAPIVQFIQNPATTKNRDITVNFSVQDMGGGIGSVYLKLNDKVIQLADGSRKLELVGGNANASQKSSGKTTQFSHLLSLQNGENTIEAYATNSAGKIESRHAVTKISWQGNTAKPNLYVLAVGVNKYRDKSLWLNYAVPDATSIADSFRGVKGNLYQSVNVTTVFDSDVTSSGIAAAFNSIAGNVSADDVFIFYLSGHGTTHTDGDYYFIPVDFRFRNAQSVPETAVSKHFITEQLSKIKAQKTLVMLDTCNSGAFISTGARGMAEKTAIDRLSRATGQATIAASSDRQSAMEGYNGHGIFTYVILEGLSGKADTNKDGYVSLSELSSYAEEKVPDYSYAKWGYEQYPQVDLRKQSNFPLVGK